MRIGANHKCTTAYHTHGTLIIPWNACPGGKGGGSLIEDTQLPAAIIETTPRARGNKSSHKPQATMMELLVAVSLLLCSGPVLVQSQQLLEDGIAI